MKNELTKRFMEENGRIKKGLKVSWNEYLKIFEEKQKEIEQKKKEQGRKELGEMK